MGEAVPLITGTARPVSPIERIKELRKRAEEILESTKKGWVSTEIWSVTRSNRYVFYRCRKCGYVGYISKAAWTRSRKCRKCGSGDVERITKEEFIEHHRKKVVEEYTAKLRFLQVAEAVVEEMLRTGQRPDRIAVENDLVIEMDGGTWVTYHGDTLEAHIEPLTKERLGMIQRILEVAKTAGYKKVVISAHPGMTYVPEEKIKEMGFEKKAPKFFWVKEVVF